MNKARLLSPTCTEHPQRRLPSASHKSLLSEPVGNARYAKMAKDITLLVRLEQGRELSVSLPRNDTVMNLKELLRELSPQSSRNSQLFYKGIALNEGKSLKAYGIRDGDSVIFAPWQGLSLARSSFLTTWGSSASDKPITVTVHTPRGVALEVDLHPTDTVRALWEKVKQLCRYELFQSHEMVYGQRVLRASQQVAELGLQSTSIVQIVLRITVKLTSLKGARWTVQVLASDQIANIKEEICDEPEKREFTSICCDDKELNERQTFEFYHIRPQMTLYGKVRMPLDVDTSAGRVSIIPFEDSTVWKTTMLAVIYAGLSPYERYQLLSDGTPLNDYIKLQDADLKRSSVLELQRIGTPPVFPAGANGVSGHLLLTAALKVLLAPLQVIATKKTTDELLREGFQRRFLLDPVELYPSLVTHCHDKEYYEGERQSSAVHLTIAALCFGRFSVVVSTFESVQSLKELIEEKSNFEVWRQRLIYAGTVLENGYPLDFYCLRDNATLTLVVEGEAKYMMLPSDRFDYSADQDFSQVEEQVDGGLVGGLPYNPPYGWKRYALRVSGAPYDGDEWLSTSGSCGEWAISYHSNVSPEYSDEFRSAGFFKGGVLTLAGISEWEEAIVPLPWEGNVTFKLAFQSRVNPLSAAKSRDARFYVSPGERDVRPYGFLVKFIKPEEPQ